MPEVWFRLWLCYLQGGWLEAKAVLGFLLSVALLGSVWGACSHASVLNEPAGGGESCASCKGGRDGGGQQTEQAQILKT